MLWHRWGTFLHILAFTEFKKKQEKFAVEQVVDAVKELQQIKVHFDCPLFMISRYKFDKMKRMRAFGAVVLRIGDICWPLVVVEM